MLGWQAAGAAPLVRGEPVLHPETIATAIRSATRRRGQGAIDAPRRVRRAHRRGHRRRDPRGLPRCSRPTRAASSSRRRRRRSPGLLQAAADGLRRGRRRRGVHGHRPRAQGSATGRSPRCRWANRSTPPRATVAERAATSREQFVSVALVTGASAGIGRAFAVGARRLAATTSCSSPATAPGSSELANELDAAHGVAVEVLAADLSTDGGVSASVEARLARRRPPVDLLVNNAGFGTYGPLRRARRRRARSTRSSSTCVALVRLTHAALGAMEARRSGAILNVASLAALPADTRRARPTARPRRSCTASPTRCTRRRGAPACT